MANTKSAKKRILVAERNRQVNRSYKSTVRTLIKKTINFCHDYKKDPSDEKKELINSSLNKTFSLIDKAVKKNVLHRNNGANKKSRVNSVVKSTLNN
ncbi:MAG: 30S ribosomal protein S20 [Prochlorococcus sp. SP3034]|nr:30S ribosomal protein S20 [Prochlorococcus sp. SP3034]